MAAAATINRTLTDEQTQIRRHFIDFLEADPWEEKYRQRIHELMSSNRNRLVIDVGDLLDFTPPGARESLGYGTMRQPNKYVPLCESAVHEAIVRREPEYLKVDYRSRVVHAGFEGSMGRVLGPRELYARHLNTMVALEGIVTKQSPLRPRMLETVHYCPDTNKFTRKEYRDQLTPMLDSSHLPTVNVMPKTDMEGHPLRTELGLSAFVDSQCAFLQEAPERAPTGQLPRSVELRFDDDLVDSVKPGDRVVVVGIFSPYASESSVKSFNTILLVNHVVQQQTMLRVPRLLDTQVSEIKSICAKLNSISPSGVLDALASSIAPAIFGLSDEKRAIVLMMAGGVERKANTTHIRGDINVLLVGEPSTAKSQLLRHVLAIAPLALSTTGKGSSGVGLTAAITVDAYTGERSLSAGAMVLADRGILCVDEFDKMSPQDRVAMHEALEQQTVTIAKAGIHASLNARCSVLAAANPIYGFYSVKHKLSFNVGLPESLLSRFDLTFIILDQHSSEYNRRVGEHILRNHMQSEPAPMDTETSTTLVGRSEELSAAPDMSGQSGSSKAANALTNEEALPMDFVRRYLQYAKTFSPMLLEASQRMICEHYVELRGEQSESTTGARVKDGFFVTARTLESIIRLATANAKLRLTNVVEECDVDVAMRLLRASVHASGRAAQQKTKERSEAAATGAPPAAGEEQPPPAKIARVEGAMLPPNTDTLPPSSAVDLSRRRVVIDALSLFRREQRSEVHLHEVRDRILQLHPAEQLGLSDLQSSIAELQSHSDYFSYVTNAAEDVIYFTQ